MEVREVVYCIHFIFYVSNICVRIKTMELKFGSVYFRHESKETKRKKNWINIEWILMQQREIKNRYFIDLKGDDGVRFSAENP